VEGGASHEQQPGAYDADVGFGSVFTGGGRFNLEVLAISRLATSSRSDSG
jgi:hypothetical protein